MTNQTAGAADTRTAQEPLGTMLVRRGLLTPEQLEAALAEQKASGDPLGKIVVALGYATPAIIAQALATQHGGLLKTEYGFATGFSAGAAAPALVSEPPVSAKKATPLDNRPAFSEPTRTRDDSLREELALASGEVEKLRDDNDRLAKLRADLEQRLAGETRRVAALERELEGARSAVMTPADDDRVAELESALAARDRIIEEFKRTGEGWKAAIAERDTAIAGLVAARDEALRSLDAAKAEPIAVDAIAAARDEARAQVEALRAELAEIVETRDAALAQVDALRAELAAQMDAVEAVGSADELADRDRAIAELAASHDEALAHVRALQTELAQAAAALDGHDEVVADLAAARDQALADLRRTKGELSERDARLPDLARERDAAVALLAERDAELARLLHAETLAAHDATPAPRWSDAARHLLFFQGADGYELVERAGPPPAVGDRVDVPGGPQHVLRLAASPAPGSPIPCAYLITP